MYLNQIYPIPSPFNLSSISPTTFPSQLHVISLLNNNKHHHHHLSSVSTDSKYMV